MTAKHLVDTNICIDVLRTRPRNASLTETLRRIAPDGLAISVITYGEAYEGILYSQQAAHNIQRWQQFLTGFDVINITAPIAEIWADVRGRLRSQGQTTPDNDLMIGATALYFDMDVLTLNFRHFVRIPGLRLYPLADDPVMLRDE
jgi:tRNA(fMet)-specific endonuclease VapC